MLTKCYFIIAGNREPFFILSDNYYLFNKTDSRTLYGRLNNSLPTTVGRLLFVIPRKNSLSYLHILKTFFFG